MFASILAAASGSNIVFLVVILLAMVLGLRALALYVLRKINAQDGPHQGKEHTHTCKFDPEEVRRTANQTPPPLVSPGLGVPDSRILSSFAGVTAEGIKQKLYELSGEVEITAGARTGKIASRNSYFRDLEMALAWVEEYYQELGIKVWREPYRRRGRTMYNIVAEIPGLVNPDRVLIIGSHLDSTAGWPWGNESRAPGADDDGSGTVAAMEIARALVNLPLGYTVRFVHFTGEEQGLYGSYAYSDKVAEAKTDLVGMIEMDMVGWCAKPGNRLDVHDGRDRNGSHELVAYFAENANRYGINLNVVDTHNHAVDNRSDHAGFLDHGYKAVLVSEEFTDDGFNPNYHSRRDRADTLNFDFMVEVVKLVIATTADLADLQADSQFGRTAAGR